VLDLVDDLGYPDSELAAAESVLVSAPDRTVRLGPLGVALPIQSDSIFLLLLEPWSAGS
jgi:hypothetical protein